MSIIAEAYIRESPPANDQRLIHRDTQPTSFKNTV